GRGGSVRSSGGAYAVRSLLTQYYTRYYRDVLGIPGWRDLVAARLREESYEAGHLARLEAVLGRPVAGLRLLNVGCGTGGFTVMAPRGGGRGRRRGHGPGARAARPA